MDISGIIELIPSDIGQLAAFLTTAAAFGLLLSWGLERWNWFLGLSAGAKKWMVYLVALGLPIIGELLGWAFWLGDPEAFPVPALPLAGAFGLWAAWVWNHFISSLLVYAATQYAHRKDPAYLDAKEYGADLARAKHSLIGRG